MLVDVIEIRRKGERLARQTIRELQPVRGLLKIEPTSSAWRRSDGNPRLLAMLVDCAEPRALLRPLDHARVTRIQRGAFLIVGWQQEGMRERDLHNVKQEWVAWPVVAGPVAESPDVQPVPTPARAA